jgi:hypothetical protein
MPRSKKIRCRGININGLRCKNRVTSGKYCHCHITQQKKKEDRNLEKRICRLISAGASLIYIIEKALEANPEILDFLTKLVPTGGGIIGICDCIYTPPLADHLKERKAIRQKTEHLRKRLSELENCTSIDESKLDEIESEIDELNTLVERHFVLEEDEINSPC